MLEIDIVRDEGIQGKQHFHLQPIEEGYLIQVENQSPDDTCYGFLQEKFIGHEKLYPAVVRLLICDKPERPSASDNHDQGETHYLSINQTGHPMNYSWSGELDEKYSELKRFVETIYAL
ncbi:MAG: hypothetical protein OEZ58_13265 [Gammaproteobacteria bacterium]|nr:hypothetical protein [Gammaproteobacteria bacterium]MDH5729958.1 hypothetical protein [Gammaproteobacteria bacterium]